MSTDYSEEELIEIENPDEIPNELYVKWMRLHYPLTQKRKRRVKQFSERIATQSTSRLDDEGYNSNDTTTS